VTKLQYDIKLENINLFRYRIGVEDVGFRLYVDTVHFRSHSYD